MIYRSVVLAVLMTIALPAAFVAGVTVDTQEVELQFAEDCPTEAGYYWTWNADGEPDRETAFEEERRRGGPQAVSWSGTTPISIGEGANAIVGQRYVFILLAADGQTTLFEREFDIEAPPGSQDTYFAIRATLDCSSIPYREIPMPNASMEVPRPPVVAILGVVLIGLSMLVGLRQRLSEAD